MSLAVPPHEAVVEGQERVTVVIPTFNDDPEHLRTAVGSALAQTWGGELEVIVVNDGSTLPETREALENLPPGVQVIHQANSGVGSARNTGIEAASGEVIICLDADDRIDSQYVAEAVHTLAQPGTVVAFPFCVTFGAVSGEQPTAPLVDAVDALRGSGIFPPFGFPKGPLGGDRRVLHGGPRRSRRLGVLEPCAAGRRGGPAGPHGRLPLEDPGQLEEFPGPP